MSENLIPLRKACGGATLTSPDGQQYHWAEDGDVVQVPHDFAVTLLAIPGAGYSVADGEAKAESVAEDEPAEVTEPAPKAEAAVTEPAPRKPSANAASKGRTAGK